MPTEFEPIELEEFVQESIRQIEAGAGSRLIAGDVEFRVLVNKTKKTGGKLKIYVVSGETDGGTEHLQEVKFKIRPNSPEWLKKKIKRISNQQLSRQPY